MTSVVMPAYNSEHFIGEAIESVLSQTYAEFEFIVVNDGSTDGTLGVIESYARRDGRMRVMSQANCGISRTLNRAVEECQSNWIALLDNDDIALPQGLERQVEASSANPRVVLWSTYGCEIDSTGRVLSIRRVGPTTEAEFRVMRDRGDLPLFGGAALFLHKPTLLAVGGFDPRFDGCQDVEITDRMAERGPVLTVPEPLVLHRRHGGNFSRKARPSTRPNMKHIALRCRARVTGETLPSLEEFLQQTASERWWRHPRAALASRSHILYGNAGWHYAQGHPVRAILGVGLAALLRPSSIAKRLWDQKFGGRARSELNAVRRQLAGRPTLGP